MSIAVPASASAPTFADFNLHAHLQAALMAAGFETPTPVQMQAIPAAAVGRDVLASAQTGTGKTGAFVLPALQRLLTTPVPKTGHGPRVLVLTPTRELAQQVRDTANLFGKSSSMRVGVIVGGVGYGPQYALLRERVDVLVATPGRLIDHLEQGKVDFSRIEVVVLDEADRMLDMGFLKPVERILAAVEHAIKRRPQTLLFTATLTPSVEKVAARVLVSPLKVSLAPAKPNHSLITQKAYQSDSQEHKFEQLKALLAAEGVDQAIIFAATKHGSDRLAEKLHKAGFASAALHGGMKQNARKRTLDQVHRGQIKLLVATDVAARGIDVKELGHVFNFDLPQVAEDYVHRIGRTGRSGSRGVAISLIAPTDVPMLRDIEKLLGKRVELGQLKGLEAELDTATFERLGAQAPRSRKQPRSGAGKGQGQGAGQGQTSRQHANGHLSQGRSQERSQDRNQTGNRVRSFGTARDGERTSGRPQENRGGYVARGQAGRPRRFGADRSGSKAV